MGLLDWFRQSTPQLDQERVSDALVDSTIDYVVKMTDARLALVNQYRARLSGPVKRSLEFLAAQRSNLPAVHEVGPLAWSIDPSMRAFFAQPADLLDTFGHCPPLLNYAAQSVPLDPIFAILAMEIDEQQRFGVGLQGEMMVRDVAHVTLSFSHHRLRLFANSEAGLWQSVSRRMLDELSLIALEHMQAEQSLRKELAEHRDLLSARLATFTRRGAGIDSFLSEAGTQVSPQESADLLHKLEENEARLEELGCPTEMLDRQLDYLAEVLAEPMRFIQLERCQPHLDSMNVVLSGNSETASGEQIEYNLVTFDRHPPQRRAFLPVRVDRALLGEARKLKLDNAERWL
ncbi:hypothetical protein GCM10027046_02290 [Uliginosibacterium flavum]|uniref:Uncharacterized protein n=1 Tax=Uliginosibacterium flavum TaxID=1396831 RepID=A0ABV2TIT1_9RHOO